MPETIRTRFPQLWNAAILGGVVVAVWAILAIPSWWLQGMSGLIGLTVAATLCLIPGWLVFALYSQYGTAAPLTLLLGATFGRMAVVLAGALVAKREYPDLDMKFFAMVLGTFYVLALTVETRLLFKPPVRGTSSDD